jgi:hypothetical protein
VQESGEKHSTLVSFPSPFLSFPGCLDELGQEEEGGGEGFMSDETADKCS